MTYATSGIEGMFTTGIAAIISPELAGMLFILFFLGIIFLRGLPTTAKVAIGIPALLLGLWMMASPSITALFVLGLGVLFIYAIWKMFLNK
jgi:hypothetical protein